MNEGTIRHKQHWLRLPKFFYRGAHEHFVNYSIPRVQLKMDREVKLIDRDRKEIIVKRRLLTRAETRAMGKVETFADGRSYELRVHVERGVRHTHAFCRASKQENNLPMICIYEQRRDRLKTETEAGRYHICQFDPQSRQFSLEDLTMTAKKEKHEPDKITLTRANDIITSEVAYLTGRLNLPIYQASDKDMSNFIHRVMELGAQAHVSGIAMTDVKIPSKQAVRQRLVEIGTVLNEARIETYRKHKYCALAIDEGSTLHTKYLNFVLHNCEHRLGEYMFDSEVMDGLSTSDYYGPLSNGFRLLKAWGLHPSVVVVDGGLAQFNALVKEWEDMELKKDETIKELIVVPCLCHRLNNVLKDMVRKCDSLRRNIETIHDIARHVAPKTPTEHMKKCPSHVGTRWLYDYEIAQYLYDNQREVADLLRTEDLDLEIPIWIKELVDLMRPLRYLCDMFEQSDRNLSSAFPMISEVLTHFRTVRQESERRLNELEKGRSHSPQLRKRCATIAEWYKQASESLSQYTLQSADGGTIALAWILTPEGRQSLSPDQPSDIAEDLARSIAQRKRKRTKPRNQLMSFPVKDRKLSRIDKEIQDDYFLEHLEDDLDSESRLLQPEDILDTEEDQFNETTHTIRVDFPRGQIRTALTNIMKNLEYSKVQQQSTLSAYESYLVDKLDPDVHLTELHDKTWNWASLLTLDSVKWLADIAMRLAVAPCSESSAERSISIQRLILTPRRSKTSLDLAKARIRIMSTPREFVVDGMLPYQQEPGREQISVRPKPYLDMEETDTETVVESSDDNKAISSTAAPRADRPRTLTDFWE